MAEEIKKVIVIDTKQAVDGLKRISDAVEDGSKGFNTLNEYRRYIDLLKQSTDKMDKSSKEYERTLKQINTAEKYLTREIDKQNSSVKAAEGSYDALAKKMADLRKEWKATSDEAKRNEIGKNILDINNQLKEMDASIGNFQRNVGDYQGAFTRSVKDLADGLDLIIPGAKKVAKGIDDAFKGISGFKELKNVFNDISKTIPSISALFTSGAAAKNVNNLSSATNTLGASMLATTVAGQGLTASTVDLFMSQEQLSRSVIASTEATEGFRVVLKNAESGLYKTEAELDAAIDAINTTGTATINTTKKIGLASVATKAWAATTTALKVALNALPFVAIIAAIGAIVSAISNAIQKHKEIQEQLKESALEVRNLGIEAYGTVEQFKVLQKAFIESEGDFNKQRQIIGMFNETLGGTFGTINNINEAEDIFVKRADSIIAKTLAKAKAQAAFKLIADDYVEYLKKIQEAEYDALKSRDEAAYNSFLSGGITAEASLINNANKKLKESLDGFAADFEKRKKIAVKLIQEAFGAFAYNQPVSEDDPDFIGPPRPKKTTTTTTTTKSTPKESEIVKYLEAFRKSKLTEIELENEAYEERKKLAEKEHKDKLDGLKSEEEYQNALVKLEEDHNLKIQKIKDDAEKEDKARIDEIKKRVESEGQTELDVLAAKYDAEKALLEKYGEDTTALTAEYENKKKAIILDNINKEVAAIDEKYATEIFIADKAIKNEHRRNEKLNELNISRLNAEKDILESRKSQLDVESDAYKSLEIEIEKVMAQITEAERNQKEEGARYTANLVRASADAVQTLASAANEIIGFMQEGIEKRYEMGEISKEQADEEFEQTKKWQIATAVINMLAGITAALASPIANAMGPAGWIAAAAQSVAIATTGAIQIAKIKQTTLSSSDSGSSTVTSGVANYTPTYTKNLTGETERQVLNQSSEESLVKAVTKVPIYVTVTDINTAQKKVEVRDKEASF